MTEFLYPKSNYKKALSPLDVSPPGEPILYYYRYNHHYNIIIIIFIIFIIIIMRVSIHSKVGLLVWSWVFFSNLRSKFLISIFVPVFDL